MGRAVLCELGIFLLYTLLCKGQAEDAVLTTDPNWSTFFAGESVTFRCDMNEDEHAEWEYKITKDGRDYVPHHTGHCTVKPLSTADSGEYQCHGRRKSSDGTKKSNTVSLTVLGMPRATLTSGTTTIPVGGSVKLTCSVESSAGWKYEWFRRTKDTAEVPVTTTEEQNGAISAPRGGIYRCRGRRGDPGVYSGISDEVTIEITFSNKAVLTRQPTWPQMFSGERITLTCEVQGGEATEWLYEWERSRAGIYQTYNNYWIFRAFESTSGDYRCKGRSRDDPYSSTEWSEAVTLSVSGKPKAQLSAGIKDIPVGGSVKLTCSVNPSSTWKYDWYRDGSLPTEGGVPQSGGHLSVSQEGLYNCRGGRGNPVYYTEYSDTVSISKIAPNKAVVTLQPTWPQIYGGEKITLRCEIQGGGTEWAYEWRSNSSYNPPNQREIRIHAASSFYTGNYECKGKMKSAQQSSTVWSDSFSLTVSDTPRPVLTVSPSWLTAGDSVALSCKVESAGWRFYWYQAVPDLGSKFGSYSYELLPDSTNGTAHDSHIIHGQTHSAGYACRAGRGDPVHYTDHSKPAFVWSGDFHSAASVTVNPDRVQHFIFDSVSLTCEGDSTEWRVRGFTGELLFQCSTLGTMIGSTCKTSVPNLDSVFWCESGSALSNAVNISGQLIDGDIILVSPVHPVTEGHPVTLGCKSRTEDVLSDVSFYKNGKLIQNDARGEMTIPAVSKSDEGFYKCERSGKKSQQSWMAVKALPKTDSSSALAPLIAGPICGIFLMILLLVLCHYKQSKDSCFIRTQRSAADHTVNLGEDQHNTYAAPVHGDAPLYDSIKGPEDTHNDQPRDVTYSSIELKNVPKKGKKHNPEESTVYSDVKMGPSTDELRDVTYSLIDLKNLPKKGKKNKPEESAVYSDVKMGPATGADEMVSSQVKPGAAVGKCAHMS